MTDETIIMLGIDEVIPYDNNPRQNDEAVDLVANSIREFGFKQPIVVDSNRIIIAGHTRWKAARKLGLKQVPVIIASDLTEEQARAYRLADNKVAEAALWDYDKLDQELAAILDIDMSEFGFTVGEIIDFTNLESRMEDEIDPEHQAFLDKFKEKHTTDDCFTPPAVYDAVSAWVLKEYGHKGRIVRPFYPGGDYQTHKYPKGCLVLDNPPFSILKEIVKFYLTNDIDFFLFADARTIGWYFEICNVVLGGVNVVFENGADIRVGFLTNLGKAKITVSASLHDAIDLAQVKETADLNAYAYPDNLMTSMQLDRLASYGSEFRIDHVQFIKKMDCGQEIFGGGVLVSDSMAKMVKDEKANAEIVKAQKVRIPIELSEREREIVQGLNQLDGPTKRGPILWR